MGRSCRVYGVDRPAIASGPNTEMWCDDAQTVCVPRGDLNHLCWLFRTSVFYKQLFPGIIHRSTALKSVIVHELPPFTSPSHPAYIPLHSAFRSSLLSFFEYLQARIIPPVHDVFILEMLRTLRYMEGETLAYVSTCFGETDQVREHIQCHPIGHEA